MKAQFKLGAFKEFVMSKTISPIFRFLVATALGRFKLAVNSLGSVFHKWAAVARREIYNFPIGWPPDRLFFAKQQSDDNHRMDEWWRISSEAAVGQREEWKNVFNTLKHACRTYPFDVTRHLDTRHFQLKMLHINCVRTQWNNLSRVVSAYYLYIIYSHRIQVHKDQTRLSENWCHTVEKKLKIRILFFSRLNKT